MTPAQLLDSKQVPYRESGRDLLVQCLNPEHDDNNPSMRIDKVIGLFNCLSCGFKGNIFLHFGESPKGVQVRIGVLREKIINKRIETLGLEMPKGHIPYQGTWRDISKSTYEKFEAFEHSSPEFAARINFPIRDIGGKICAFIGRHTGDGERYKISPPGAAIPLYPMHLVRPFHGRVVLVEGIFDMLRCHDAGLTNTICAFGTNTLTDKKLSLLKVAGIEGLDIMFDSDKAGKEAAEALKERASKDFDVRIINLKTVNDPGSMSTKQLQGLKRAIYGDSIS